MAAIIEPRIVDFRKYELIRPLRADVMPPLIRFVLKWTLIGVLAGWAFLALFLWLDIGGVGSLVWHSPSSMVALYVLAVSFAVTSGPVVLAAAVLLRKDFGGAGGSGNTRLERWKSGRSAEIDPDRPRGQEPTPLEPQ